MRQRVAYVYQVPIMDLWEPMIPFECRYEYESFENCKELRELLDRYLYQLANHTESYWEGDVRTGELYVGEIPDPTITGGVHTYFGLKQDNNGTTFLIFPFPMPIYAEYECNYIEYFKQPKFHDEIINILNEYAPPVDELMFVKQRLKMIQHHQERINREFDLIQSILPHKECEE